jgi:4a-hydroxytetrahydrobiopterin dehydratase
MATVQELTAKKCVPCEGGVASYTRDQAQSQLADLSGWELREVEGHLQIQKKFSFTNFIEAMKFANAVGDLAEGEGHHPDLIIGYGRVEVLLWTHAIDGLSENDFIVAAKVDALE